MRTLSRLLLEQGGPELPADLVVGPLERFPVKVLQFGEGNFLRGDPLPAVNYGAAQRCARNDDARRHFDG